MSGPQSEYVLDRDVLEDCSMGLKDLKARGTLQVKYDSAGKCSKAKDCKTPCKHRKK